MIGNEAKNISKSDLFPEVKPEVLHMIFRRTLQRVYGIRLDHFYMMPVTFETAYPQIFDGFLPIGNLFIHMERFFPICRVNDFQPADVISPKAKKTARFLSGILNFFLFFESRREVYLKIQSTYKSAMEKEQQLSAAVVEATLKLEKFDTIPPDQQIDFKELSKDIQDLEQILNQEYRQKTSTLQEDINKKKTEIAEKNQTLSELKLAICALKEEWEQLKSKITESPEELTNCKVRLKETLEKNKGDQKEVIKKYEAYRDLVEMFPSFHLEVQLYQKKMQTQAANVDRLSNILAELRTLEDQVENATSALNNATREQQSLKRLVTVKQEQLGTAEMRSQKMREDIELRKQAITECCDKFQKRRETVCEKLKTTQAEIIQLKGALQQFDDNSAKEKSKAQEIYLSLRVGLEKYHENLARIVDCYTTAREKKISELARLF